MPVAEVMEPEVKEVVKTNPTLADHYDLAASLLEEYGWIQNGLGIRQTGFCMMGAINETFGDSHKPPSGQTVIDIGFPVYNIHLPILEATNYQGAMWNDIPGRTKEEVIAKLHEVAAELRRSKE